MSFERLGDITRRIVNQIEPTKYTIAIVDPLAKHLEAYAKDHNIKSETVIAEALRAYLGDAA